LILNKKEFYILLYNDDLFTKDDILVLISCLVGLEVLLNKNLFITARIKNW